MKDFSNGNRHVWDDQEDDIVGGELLEGNGPHLKISIEERVTIHAYVLQNTSSFDQWHRWNIIYMIFNLFNFSYYLVCSYSM